MMVGRTYGQHFFRAALLLRFAFTHFALHTPPLPRSKKFRPTRQSTDRALLLEYTPASQPASLLLFFLLDSHAHKRKSILYRQERLRFTKEG